MHMMYIVHRDPFPLDMAWFPVVDFGSLKRPQTRLLPQASGRTDVRVVGF